MPALPAVGRRAQGGSLGLQLCAAPVLSHMGSIRAAVWACNTCPGSAVRLLVSPALAGPQLTGARCMGLQLACPQLTSNAGDARLFICRSSSPSPLVQELPSYTLPCSFSADAGWQHASAARRDVAAAPAWQPCRQVRAHQWARAASPSTLSALEAAGLAALRHQPQGRCRRLNPEDG